MRTLANWQPRAERTDEIPFVVARIAAAGLHRRAAARRPRGDALRRAARCGSDPKIIEPLVPVDLVVDHSVQVDYSDRPDALQLNMEIEFKRNQQRYQFLKWGMQAFNGFSVVPPGIGIVHQVNLEYLARGVLEKDGVCYPDTLVGTDSHTTMINGLGIVGWGVGGIEAEAGMLGQPVYFLTPDVVGVHLTGALREGVTATDLVLHHHRDAAQGESRRQVRRVLRRRRGVAAAGRPRHHRQHGARVRRDDGLLPGRRRDLPLPAHDRPHRGAGRRVPQLLPGAGPVRHAAKGEIDYTHVLELDLASVAPSVAGPKRPQDRIELDDLKRDVPRACCKAAAPNGYGKPATEIERSVARRMVGVTSTGPSAPSPAAASRIRRPRRTRWRSDDARTPAS